MGKEINVDVKKLDAIYDYVQDFQNKVLLACDELSGACDSLKSTNSEEDLYQIDSMLVEVRSIIESEQPTFDNLKESIKNYSEKVKQIKKILGK